MAQRTKQAGLTMPMSLDAKFRDYCGKHHLGRTEALAYLLDNAEQNDVLIDCLTSVRDTMERNIKALESIDGSNNKVISDCHQSETTDAIPSANQGSVPTTGRLMPYGLHKGKPVLDVIRNYPDYITKLLDNASTYPPSQRFILTCDEQRFFDHIRQQIL